MLLGQTQVALADKAQHRPFGQLVKALLTDIPLLSRILSEKEIEYDAQQGQERKHQQPCHGLHGLTVVHQHPEHRSYNSNAVDEQDYPVNINHS